MVITTTKTLTRNVSKASIATECSSREITFMDAYGEPMVNAGGTIPIEESSYILPDRQVFMRNGSPIEQNFDGNVDEQAAAKLTAWVAEIIVRLTAAKTTLMAKPTPQTPNVVVQEV